MPIDYLVTDTELSDIADAIRAKGGTSASISFPNGFTTAIAAIPTGVTPTGTKQISITQNGTTTEDVTNYASAEINVNVNSLPNYIGHVSVTPVADSRTISFTVGSDVRSVVILSNYDSSSAPSVTSVIGGSVSFANDGTFNPIAYQKVLVHNTNGNLSYWAITSSGGQAWSYADGVLTIACSTAFWWRGGVTYDAFSIYK